MGTCSGVPEADRSDKPAYVRNHELHHRAGARPCATSQMRAIMTADDEFGATMKLLSDSGVLANTMVIFSSDNGYNWGEHGRWEKFVPYEPSIRVPLLVRWPGHFDPGSSPRTVSYVDLLPTMLEAAEFQLPVGAPRLDGESLLQPSGRTTTYAEYYNDPANKNIPAWRMVRTSSAKFVLTYNAAGAVIAREYYNLATDPPENTNLLGDGNTANDPSPSTIRNLTTRLNAFATCAGAACVK